MDRGSILVRIAVLKGKQVLILSERNALKAASSAIHDEIVALEAQLNGKEDAPFFPTVIVPEPVATMPMQVVEQPKPVVKIKPVAIVPKPFKPGISDHAVIRYLERAHGFSFDDVKHRLLSETVISAMHAGAVSVKTPEGRLIIKGDTVVTFQPHHTGNHRQRQGRRPTAPRKQPVRFYDCDGVDG